MPFYVPQVSTDSTWAFLWSPFLKWWEKLWVLVYVVFRVAEQGTLDLVDPFWLQRHDDESVQHHALEFLPDSYYQYCVQPRMPACPCPASVLAPISDPASASACLCPLPRLKKGPIHTQTGLRNIRFQNGTVHLSEMG